MNANLTHRMEIAFWDMFIYLLADKAWFQKAVRFMYVVLPRENIGASLKMLLSFAGIGFTSGVVFYLLVLRFF